MAVGTPCHEAIASLTRACTMLARLWNKAQLAPRAAGARCGLMRRRTSRRRAPEGGRGDTRWRCKILRGRVSAVWPAARLPRSAV